MLNSQSVEWEPSTTHLNARFTFCPPLFIHAFLPTWREKKESINKQIHTHMYVIMLSAL